MSLELTSAVAAEPENAISATTQLKMMELGGGLECPKTRREENGIDAVPSWMLDDVGRKMVSARDVELN